MRSSVAFSTSDIHWPATIPRAVHPLFAVELAIEALIPTTAIVVRSSSSIPNCFPDCSSIVAVSTISIFALTC